MLGSPRPCRQISGYCYVRVSMGEPWLHLVQRGRVVLDAVIAFNRDLAGFHVQDHVAEPSTAVLISVGDKGLKVFLQVREVRVLDFALFVSVILSGVALDVFTYAFIACTVEVDGYKRDSRVRQSAEFGEDSCFCRGLLGGKRSLCI